MINSAPTSVVFIDGSVAGTNALLAGVPETARIVRLDNSQDGILQMASLLSDFSGLESIHVLSHGAQAQLPLGNVRVSHGNLADYRDALAAIGNSLGESGDILLYGCNLGAGEQGAAFVQRLAEYTGADVAASDDLTGSRLLGGDWQLETRTGEIQAASLRPFGFAGTLASWTGTIGPDLHTGTAADDDLTGLAGNDTLNGGDGDDTAVYSGNLADFVFGLDSDGRMTVSDNQAADGDEGTDTLSSIEQAQFADASVAIEAFSEFRVNTETLSPQIDPAVTHLNDGGWLVTWSSNLQDGDGYGIYAQRYAADGTATGSEFRVNTHTSSSQTGASVAVLADGGWLVTWQSFGQDGDNLGVYAQRYASDGTASGGEFLVNTETASVQTAADVAALADGGWVVSWYSLSQDGNFGGIYAQRYAADGSLVGGETLVNTTTLGNQTNPSITALGDGGWLVAWNSFDQDGSGWGVYAQRYAADGSTVGAEFQVNSYTTSDQSLPSVASLADGGWVVTWQSLGQDGASDGIYGQRYAANGAPAGAEFLVNTYTTSAQGYPAVTGLADGGWLVTWESFGQDGSSDGVFAQRYAANGSTSGAEFQINAYTADGQYFPAAAALSDGGWLIAWQSENQDGSSFGVYARRFDSSGAAMASVASLAGDGVGNKITWGASAPVSIDGKGGKDELSGAAGADTLDGGAGNDTLRGGGGADSLVGGAGDDSYEVDNAGDQLVELSGEGTDQVTSSVSFTLPDHLEQLTLSGGADLEGTGNAADNLVTGNSGNNRIKGVQGEDTVVGGDGNDTLLGGAGNDTFVGGAGDDIYFVNLVGDNPVEVAAEGHDLVKSLARLFRLTAKGEHLEDLFLIGKRARNGVGNTLDNEIRGNQNDNRLKGLAGDDTVIGGAGNDTLLGGKGADKMFGSDGDDTFFVNSSSDEVVERVGKGNDWVKSRVSISLRNHSQFLEMLTLLGKANRNGSGNQQDNRITGNQGNNRLNGLIGDDTLLGGKGNDTLLGGKGADRMFGGEGDDTFFVAQTTDQVIEKAGNGTDLVKSSVTFDLRKHSQHLENLSLTGKLNRNGTGNMLANEIRGNGGSNRLSGLNGNDALKGFKGNDTLLGGIGSDLLLSGAGADTLTGGAGGDRFRYRNASQGNDTITDFKRAAGDRLQVLGGNFAGLAKGVLGPDHFRANKAGVAKDADDYFVFNTSTNTLFYDKDGNGSGAAVRLATFSNGHRLRRTDIAVI